MAQLTATGLYLRVDCDWSNQIRMKPVPQEMVFDYARTFDDVAAVVLGKKNYKYGVLH